ncbi:MAG: beta-glucoside-specific PTS transporter subunit IIABC [Clostridiales bacterium]|nr:beta-glucoside-specific PTS transporter subunit IIABC [Clostridiales bacterium]
MANADYTQLAADVVKAVGGKENIIDVTNCMTRLRFVLKDDSIPNKDQVMAVKGVKGVMNQGGQYQVIIGTHVNEVVKDVRKAAGIGEGGIDKESMKLVKKDSLWNRFFKTISGCIMPMLGPMIAGGIIKGVLTILTTFGLLSSDSGTYLVLYAAADSILYFMPIIVGFTCGKVFDCNPYVTAVVGAALVYPDLVTAVSAEEGIKFLGITVASASYSSTFLPIVLAGFLASKLEKLGKKFIPKMLQLMLVPAFVLVITVPLSWLVIGPIMNALSNALSIGMNAIFNFNSVIGGAVFGAFWQLMVVLGLHAAMIPILMSNLLTQGSDPINGVMGLTVWALAGVSLGYALKSKDPEKKSMGFGDLASTLCGVTEPTIYSIALPNIKLFACAWIGGGLAGAIFGGLGGRLYSFAGDGLFRIPGMINPEGLDISFYGFIACALLAFAVSGILAFILTDAGEAPVAEPAAPSEAAAPSASASTSTKPMTIYAPVQGKVIPRTEIPDLTFAEGILGDGVGIDPTEGLVVAPFDGEITSVVDSKHAVGIASRDGMELLIHVGVDTVKMNGKGFQTLVKEGDEVKAGQELIRFDIDEIKKAGFSPVTAVLVTNSDDYGSLQVQETSGSRMEELISVR